MPTAPVEPEAQAEPAAPAMPAALDAAAASEVLPDVAALAETIELQVPFHDLDPADIVWHGNYVRYLALARDALMNRIGYGHAQMKRSGYGFPVVDIRLRFVRPARLDQRIRVTAQIIEFDPRLRLRYAVLDADSGARLARAHTTQVAVDVQSGAMRHSAPEALRRCIQQACR